MSSTLVFSSEELAPLSQEHREGLLFVRRIRQYLNTVSTERLKKYVLWFWKNHIRSHFFQEERIILPCLPPDHPISERLKEEHEDIRDLVLSLDRKTDKATIMALCDLLDLHIQFEEQQLFGYLELNLPKEQLARLRAQIENYPVIAGRFEDEFWLSRGYDLPL